jgi:hypothetical protein
LEIVSAQVSKQARRNGNVAQVQRADGGDSHGRGHQEHRDQREVSSPGRRRSSQSVRPRPRVVGLLGLLVQRVRQKEPLELDGVAIGSAVRFPGQRRRRQRRHGSLRQQRAGNREDRFQLVLPFLQQLLQLQAPPPKQTRAVRVSQPWWLNRTGVSRITRATHLSNLLVLLLALDDALVQLLGQLHDGLLLAAAQGPFRGQIHLGLR